MVPTGAGSSQSYSSAARSPSTIRSTTLLRCLIGGQANALSNRVSNRLGEFGECSGGSKRSWGLDGEFVVAAA